MLIIKPVQEKKDQENYCAECEAHYEAESLAYAAWVDEKLAGICQFVFKPDGAHILTLRPAKSTDDWDALFIMGRQAMNYTDLHGIHVMFYDDKPADGMPGEFISRLGFAEKEGNRRADLAGFFDNPCGHGKAGSAM